MDDSIIRGFSCKDVSLICDDKEDSIVGEYRDSVLANEFQIFLKHPPYHYFCRQLLPEDVNMCSINNHLVGVYKNIDDWVKPFETNFMGSFNLMKMTDKENEAFYTFNENKQIYLAIRNSIIALWFLNPKKFLVTGEVMNHIIVRGLIRVKLEVCVHYILDYLTQQGSVNYGFVSGREIPLEINDKINEQPIVVIGAGLSGISTAYHLRNMGYKVKILEASDTPGGRIRDMTSSTDSKIISIGGDFIDGDVNNPLSMLAKQLGLKTIESIRDPVLYTSAGKRLTFQESNRNGVYLDLLLESGCAIENIEDDRDLLSMMKDHLKDHNGNDLSEEELFYMVHNIENTFGTSCSNISSRNFGYLESLQFYSGKRIYIKEGFSKIINKFCEYVDIEFNSKVSGVLQTTSGVEVRTTSGHTHYCSRCVVSAPVFSLDSITFQPPLPSSKIASMQMLGYGLQEKVVLRFRECFWRPFMDSKKCLGVCKGSDLDARDTLGNVCRDFAVFYDLTNKEDQLYTLTATVSRRREDNVSRCLDVLAQIVGGKIPAPVETFCSDWTETTSYITTYPKPRCENDARLHLETPFERVHFTGDTYYSEHMPSMVAAYLSGIKTALVVTQDI